MNKNKLLKIVNPLLLLSLILQALTGYFREGRHTLEEVHEANAVVFLLLALGHLYLNWAWVKSNFLKNAHS
jgi:hypothetical protein